MSEKMVKLVYFAWVRERIGKAEEMVALPPGASTIADIIVWLVARGEEYAHAFENAALIRVAVDKTHRQHGFAVGDAQEIAFFPPMTGG